MTIVRSCATGALGVVLTALVGSSSRADFTPLGNSGWEYEAPAGVAIPANMVAPTVWEDAQTMQIGTTNFKLEASLTSFQSVSIHFRTMANTSQIEHFFMMDMKITNVDDDEAWNGFAMYIDDLIDVGPQPHVAPVTHPKWAHFHPIHQAGPNGSGTNYDGFTTIYPNTNKGTPLLLAGGGGTIQANSGDSWDPTLIRMHDRAFGNNNTGPMDFILTLQPSGQVPGPGGLALLALMCVRSSRRRAK